VKYLFEGQTGGRYSAESVYRVFKQALKEAGIKKMSGYIVCDTVMPCIFMRVVWITGIYRNCRDTGAPGQLRFIHM
jgi:hypothetical protein